MEAYRLSTEEIIKELKTSKQGLTSSEASRRLNRYGPNTIKETKKISKLKIFFNQFKSFLIAILIIAAIISFTIGDHHGAYVITGILMMNAILGFIQEYRAEKAIEALKKLTSHKAKVLRNNKEIEIPASQFFQTEPLSLIDWIWITLVSSTVLIYGEIHKFISRHFNKNQKW